MSIQHFQITQRGQSHIENDLKCQDYSGYKETTLGKNGPLVAVSAIADGLGSCAFSDEGSRIAVESVLSYIQQNLAELDTSTDDEVLSVLRNGFISACDEIDAYSREKYPITELATTLTVALFLETGTTYIAHIGDSGIVAMFSDGDYKLVTTRHKGDSGNSVYPLYGSESETKWEFKRLGKPVAALVLMTDGVLDNCVDREKLDSRVYFPFLARALTKPYDTIDEAEHEHAYWDEMLKNESWRNRITDDITFSTIQNPELVHALPIITFDEDAWKQRTQEVRTQEEFALKVKGEEQQESLNNRYAQKKNESSTDVSAHAKSFRDESGCTAKETISSFAEKSNGTQANKKELQGITPHAGIINFIVTGQLIHMITAVSFTVFVTICMQQLFPHDGIFLRLVNIVLSGSVSCVVSFLSSRLLYIPHIAKTGSNKKFWGTEAIVTIEAMIASILVFMLIYRMWMLFILPAILIIAIVFLMLSK